MGILDNVQVEILNNQLTAISEASIDALEQIKEWSYDSDSCRQLVAEELLAEIVASVFIICMALQIECPGFYAEEKGH